MFVLDPSINSSLEKMMYRSRSTAELHFGSNAGGSLYEAMRRAKHSIFILSPFVSLGYIEFLTEIASRGIHVTLVSNHYETPEMKEIYKKVVKQERSINYKRWMIRKSGFLFCLSLLILIFVFWAMQLKMNHELVNNRLLVVLEILMGLSLFAFSKTRVYFYHYSSSFDFISIVCENKGSQREFLHAKIYLIDGSEVYIGSANLTFNGFRSNIEMVANFSDEALAASIRNGIADYLNSVSRVDLEVIGPTLYTEPPN